jgi:hypothetical protein
MLYSALVRSKPEYVPVAQNSIMINDSNKLEHIPRQSAALCHNTFFQNIPYQYNIMETLNLQTLHNRCGISEALFLKNVYNSAKFCLSVIATVGVHVPATFLCSESVLQPDVLLLLKQFVN